MFPPVAEGAAMNGRPQLLVVEDDPQVLSVLCDVLTTEGGYGVTAAEDGTAAMAALTQPRCFDLLLLALRLSKISGVIVAAHAISQDIPVLLTSESPALVDAASRLGVDMLMKPYPLGTVCRRIETILGRSSRSLGIFGWGRLG